MCRPQMSEVGGDLSCYSSRSEDDLVDTLRIQNEEKEMEIQVLKQNFEDVVDKLKLQRERSKQKNLELQREKDNFKIRMNIVQVQKEKYKRIKLELQVNEWSVC